LQGVAIIIVKSLFVKDFATFPLTGLVPD